MCSLFCHWVFNYDVKVLPMRLGSGPGDVRKRRRDLPELFRHEPAQLGLSRPAVVDASGRDAKPVDGQRRASDVAEFFPRRPDGERLQRQALLNHGLSFGVPNLGSLNRTLGLRDWDQGSGRAGEQGRKLG